MIDKLNRSIVLFGAGIYGQIVQNYLKEINVDILFYCDNDKSKQGKFINGIEVISVERLSKIDDITILITARHCVNSIKEQLDMLNIESMSFDSFIVKYRYEEFNYIYENYLNDKTSKKTYKSILKCMITGENKYCRDIMEHNAFYALPSFTNTGNDIFVDAGAYVGDTLEQFIWNNIGQFNKIYAFEPGEKQFNAMKYRVERLKKEWSIPMEKIELINAGLGERNTYINYFENKDALLCSNFIKTNESKEGEQKLVYSIDEYLNGRKVTFIKADIEGFEMEMLKGAKNTIKTFRPKLAISVYHKPDDLIEITKFIKNIVPEYKIDIRHHAPTLVDTVLYCWIE